MPRRYVSPLRYPGGKARMAPFLADMFASQYGPMDVEVWIEPFAGGLGAGLTMLDAGHVEEVWFCEKNPALAALWRALIASPHEVAHLVEGLSPSLALYDAALETVNAAHDDEGVPDLTVAVAALVVNRCSRSGIIAPTVGPVGGKHQTGRWTVASRFDPVRIADRIRDLAPLTARLRYLGSDAIRYIQSLDQSGIEDEVMLFVDPPYVQEGNRLYAAGMALADHRALAAALNTTPARWALTYDAVPLVRDDLYPGRRIIEFDIAHTANRSRVDREYLVLSPYCIRSGDAPPLPRGDHQWVRPVDQDSGVGAQAVYQQGVLAGMPAPEVEPA